jgi:GMP synthase (glutamine-hydrolysing)
MSKILVIQHVANEGLGILEEELKTQNFSTETLMASDSAVFPSGVKLEEYGALIVLGGPMGAYEEDKYPWMKKELLVIQEALRQKKPILGICLGAQLLAKAAGARVYPGDRKEIGWGPVRLDDWYFKRNPLFFQIDPVKEHMVFHWHGDTFDLPTEGYRLAWNENYPNQAFCFQGNAVGLQFHIEMTDEMIRDWMPKALEDQDAAAAIVAESAKYLPALRDMAHKIVYGFASLIRNNVRRAA